MNIYVYWNRNNNDCTKIFHFMSRNDEHSVVEFLEQDNNLSIKRIYQPFEDKNEILKDIQHNELIIFLTHGTEKQILKYQNCFPMCSLMIANVESAVNGNAIKMSLKYFCL